MAHTRRRRPWLARLPRGLREQPAWIFVGFLIGLAGVGYLTGIADSTVTRAIGTLGLRIWGAALTFSGFGLVAAVLRYAPAFEKLALRTMSSTMLVYIGWLWVVVEPKRVAMSTVLVLILVGLAEIRVAVINALLKVSEEWT